MKWRRKFIKLPFDNMTVEKDRLFSECTSSPHLQEIKKMNSYFAGILEDSVLCQA